jgi:16S rRNA (adenine1518-N6/adenine1519-N6)-dimethyltransferase
MTVPRQTLSYLRSLLDQRGMRPKNKLGQNFLIDQNLLDLIVREAALTREDLVLEVGSGSGTLTGRLADGAGAVLSIEVDADFYRLASELLASRPNVRFILADALKNKNEINPEVTATLDEMQREFACTRRKLIANLPYVIATPLIANILIADLGFVEFVVTVQLEIAERLSANPGEKAHGALAVLVQSVADVLVIRRLPPEVFWPRPKVESAIVRVTPNAAKRALVGDVAKFRVFLRDLYTHRRKNLRGALIAMPNIGRDKAEVDAKLAELGLDGSTRAEDLDVAAHLRLAAVFG